MIKLLEFLLSVILIGVSISLITMFAWFVFAMTVNFWRIYVKSKVKQKADFDL
jgi:hypothetical protein